MVATPLCFACQAPRATIWRCERPGCGRTNENKATCDVCGWFNPLVEKRMVKRPKNDTSKCPKCSYLNEAKDMICSACMCDDRGMRVWEPACLLEQEAKEEKKEGKEEKKEERMEENGSLDRSIPSTPRIEVQLPCLERAMATSDTSSDFPKSSAAGVSHSTPFQLPIVSRVVKTIASRCLPPILSCHHLLLPRLLTFSSSSSPSSSIASSSSSSSDSSSPSSPSSSIASSSSDSSSFSSPSLSPSSFLRKKWMKCEVGGKSATCGRKMSAP